MNDLHFNFFAGLTVKEQKIPRMRRKLRRIKTVIRSSLHLSLFALRESTEPVHHRLMILILKRKTFREGF